MRRYLLILLTVAATLVAGQAGARPDHSGAPCRPAHATAPGHPGAAPGHPAFARIACGERALD